MFCGKYALSVARQSKGKGEMAVVRPKSLKERGKRKARKGKTERVTRGGKKKKSEELSNLNHLHMSTNTYTHPLAKTHACIVPADVLGVIMR